MNKKIVILVFLLLTGCTGVFDPAFGPYMQFIEEKCLNYCEGRSCAKCDMSNVSVVFKDEYEEENILGQCNWTVDVTIKRSFWEKATECQRQVLLLHEVGHAQFNLKHVKSRTIMYPYLIYEGYCKNPEKYLELFFKKRK